MIEQDFRRELSKLNFPILIRAGLYDGDSTPKYATQYQKFIPQAKFVMFEQSGYNPFLEEPEIFYPLFDKFLSIK